MAENPRIEDLRRRLEKEPGSRIFAQLAEELRKEGDFAEAIRVSRAGLAQHPTYPSARMTLGRALFDSGDLPAARGEFEAVLRGAPDNILASRFLAESLEAMGDLGSALMQYRSALRLAPGDRFLEVQIRALEQKLTPPRRSTESAPPARGPGIPPPRPAPATESTPSPAALPPGFEPSPTILISTPAPAMATPARRPEPAAPAPPAAGKALHVPPMPPAPPPGAPLVARPVRAAPAAREESFELEAPFDGSRLRAAEPPSRRPLEFDDQLDETLDETLDGRLERPIDGRPDAPTSPRLAASVPRERPSRAADQGPDMGTRPVPTVSRPVLEPPPAVAAAAPAAAEPHPVGSRAPLPPLAHAPAAEPVHVAGAAGAGESPPLASSTLAELYLRQGFVDRAIEVYQQLLEREPGNEQARTRMRELSAPQEQRAARRRDIERTIARLEELLATVRRHAPVGGTK